MTIGTDTLFSDNFNRSDGGLGSDWTTVSGSPAISSNQQSGSGIARVSSNSNFANANYSIQADQHMASSYSGGSVDIPGHLELYGRLTDGDNYYGAIAEASGNPGEGIIYISLVKQVSGVPTVLAYEEYIDQTGGNEPDVTTWRLDLDGSSLKFYGDGSLLLSATDSALTGTGYPAIDSAGYASDNFIVKGTTGGGGGASQDLSGTGVTVGQGSVTGSAAKALTGSAATVGQGSVAPASSTALASNESAVAQGTITPSVSLTLSGHELTISLGNVSPNQQEDEDLSGVEAGVSVGDIEPQAAKTLAGNELAISQGSVRPAIVITLSGHQIGVTVGNIEAGGESEPARPGMLLGRVVIRPALGGKASIMPSLGGKPKIVH